MKRSLSYAGTITGIAAVLLAYGHSNYTSTTPKPGSSRTGCSCHGGSPNASVVVAFAGPDTIKGGVAATFSLSISGGTGTEVCVDIAASAGALTPAPDATVQTSGGELITNGIKSYSGGKYTYNFVLTAPAAGGAVTLYGTGTSTRSNWNFAPNKNVVVLPGTPDTSTAPTSLSEGFESGLSTTAPATETDIVFASGTWKACQVMKTTTASQIHGGAAAAQLKSNAPGGSLVTPSLNTLGTLKFWSRASSALVLTVQKSVGGGPFVNLQTFTLSATYTEYSIAVNDAGSDVRIKFVNLSASASEYVDDVTITPLAQPTGVSSDFVSSVHPSNPYLLQSYPNPFNPSTTLRYRVPAAQLIQLGVYDLSGRCIRMLKQGPSSAGEFMTQWEGMDESGRSVPSGVYFARLATTSGVKVQKMVLAR